MRGRSSQNRGSVVLVALCLVIVLEIALTSYIALCLNSLKLGDRSFQGSQSSQLAEMGLEEALWALNNNIWTGWTIAGTTATRTITTLNGFPTPQGVTGTIKLKVTNYNSPTPTLVAEGTTARPNSPAISKQLTATAARATLLPNALAALSPSSTYAVRFRAGGTVDSYDSTLGTYASQTPTDRALVSAPTVTLTNASVYGYVATGGTPPTVGSSARVYGSASPASPKIDPSRVSTGLYQPLLTVPAVTGTGTSLGPGPATLSTAGTYYGSSLTLGTFETLRIDAPVIIDLTGTLTLTGDIFTGGRILINAGGSLEMHIAGDIVMGGRGIDNQTLLPKKCIIFGSDTGNDTPTISTNAALYAVFYMPNDGLTFSGTAPAIYGAIVARTIYFSYWAGTPAIHYDTSLRTTTFSGVTTPFVLTGWQELVDAANRQSL